MSTELINALSIDANGSTYKIPTNCNLQYVSDIYSRWTGLSLIENFFIILFWSQLSKVSQIFIEKAWSSSTNFQMKSRD